MRTVNEELPADDKGSVEESKREYESKAPKQTEAKKPTALRS